LHTTPLLSPLVAFKINLIWPINVVKNPLNFFKKIK